MKNIIQSILLPPITMYLFTCFALWRFPLEPIPTWDPGVRAIVLILWVMSSVLIHLALKDKEYRDKLARGDYGNVRLHND